VGNSVDDRRRRVVPRWWPFSTAANLGQLDAAHEVREARSPTPKAGELEELQRDWARDRNACIAAELVDFALILGERAIAEDAASWLLENGGVSAISLQLAAEILTPSAPPEPWRLPALSQSERRSTISAYRARLRERPRDPLLWVDLAREYSALGQVVDARRALQTAIGLAPDSRFVLRSASRFFLHTGDYERAHAVVAGSPATPTDPWLIAAEIVASEAAGRTSRLVKPGLRLLESERFHPRHVSELASALGTLEHDAGRRKHVRRLFSQALCDPTENSVAQASWLARHMPGFELPDSSLEAPRAYEARAWESVRQGDLAEAVQLAKEWLRDEPFASRPALMGSWVAGTGVGDFEMAGRLAEAARAANPDDPRLLAEVIYSEASCGRWEEAEKLLPALQRLARRDEGRSTEWEVMIVADKGLIAYRRGDREQGRVYYEQAIDLATRNDLNQWAASAHLNHMREEMIANPAAPLDQSKLSWDVNQFPQAARNVVRQFAERITRSRS